MAEVVGRAFLDEYDRERATAASWPESPETRHVLLGAMTIDKALYELGYELSNRPERARILLLGILQLR